MDRPNQPDAPNGEFRDDGVDGAFGTVLRAAWLNGLTTELINLIAASGQVPDGADLEQIARAVTTLGAGGATNHVINGCMSVWQRGQIHDVWDEWIYTADRWEVQADGSGGDGRGRVTQQTDASAPGTIKGRWNFMRYESQAAPTEGGPAIRTKLEVLPELSGHSLALSFLARAQVGTTITVEVSRSLNETLSVITSEQVQITQGWEERLVTFDLPNLGPLGIGDEPPFLQVEFRAPDIAGNALELGGVQLGIGAASLDFVPRPFSYEYFLCRRYFQTSGEYGSTEQSDSIGGPLKVGGRLVSIYASLLSFQQFNAERFVPEMRAIPSISLFAGAPGGPAGRVSWPGSSGVVSQISFPQRGSIGVPIIVGGAPSELTDCTFRWAADAEL